MSNHDPDSVLHVSPFEAIRREAEDGSEYWNARELARILGYTQYNKFTNAIAKAEEACKNSGQAASDHFTHVGEMIEPGTSRGRQEGSPDNSRTGWYAPRRFTDAGQEYPAAST
jgi:DNA-damage-inducible protein D